jgi:molybdopterin-guanine dinucleotide biosynthesis protein MobB
MTAPELPPIVSIVGKSNTGKTTLIEKLIPLLVARGWRVGTIKHDAHSFDVDHPGKDTWRHREAGAAVVALSSAERLFVTRTLSAPPSLAEIVASAFAGHVDLVVTEGYKRGGAVKIEVHRNARSDALICDPAVDDLVAVVSDRAWEVGVPVFGLDDAEAIVEFIVTRFLA